MIKKYYFKYKFIYLDIDTRVSISSSKFFLSNIVDANFHKEGNFKSYNHAIIIEA